MPIRFAGLGLVLMLVLTACGGSAPGDQAASSSVADDSPATTQAAPVSESAAERTDEPWSPKTIGELDDPVSVIDVAFGSGIPENWYTQIWMKPAEDEGEITVGRGVRFTGRGGSTRLGIMADVGFDVGEYSHVVLAVDGVVLDQGLAGTGWHGREAPLAVLVTYVDEEGTEHVSLGEDPTIPTAMFFRGFTTLPEADMVNGVEVVLGEDFSHQFDLMELDPEPVTILGVGVEGAGWDPRVGEVFELQLAAGF
jgi:hypothetical protein